ncbi:hypothetical protein CPB83DRAFT_903260 [Crepidotus variabilis]|uniref:Zinc finger PHD-type domain-containing protein n=1 Tax=Crepidotus variabilis TaxID=179855 RepID=A0A9P6EQK0_9AGAR|nr:hypothetical protein CPB83DRAFT_903260 [Crepidotus variabilis]
MVLGFITHVYQYFKTEDVKPADASPKRASSPTPQSTKAKTIGGKTAVPCYGKNGRVKFYVEESDSDVDQGQEKHQSRSALLRQNKTTTTAASAKPITKSADTPASTKNPIQPPASTSQDGEPLDPWIDGPFIHDFTHRQASVKGALQTHWAMRGGGGDRYGDDHAETPDKGKKATRTCLGVLQCDNADCDRAARPKTQSGQIAEQVEEGCECGARLYHQKCSVRQIIYTWADGKRFINEGHHTHARPPVIHATRREEIEFSELVKQNPRSGPLQLMVGVPGFEGPGKTAADISEFYGTHGGRISKKRLQIKKTFEGPGGGDGFIATFAEFDREHPGFVVAEVFGDVTVISVQTDFMLENAVPVQVSDEPVNGFVNDAAHGWWGQKNSLLMVISAYSPTLHCWVPVLLSYTNGARGQHFLHHFLALFEGLAVQASRMRIEVSDCLFAGVMDFSEAERDGFIRAFVRFWQRRPENTRGEEELKEAARKLLRGCQEHFRAAVTRISRIAAVIPPKQQDSFVARACSLVTAKSLDEFYRIARLIIRDFPLTATWLAWWMRESHACMIFEAKREMDLKIWESIPQTTNAEEAMHWKLYAACGRHHAFFEGFRALWAFCLYYQRQYQAEIKGDPTRYGKPEPWKEKKEIYGRTKPSRAPDPATKKRKQNDGRPPDTIKELVKSVPSKKAQKELTALERFLKPASSSSSSTTLPSSESLGYPWSNNSCWLDMSLQLIFKAATRNYEEFSSALENLPSDSLLYHLFNSFNLRRALTGKDTVILKKLGKQRNDLRKQLVDMHLAATMKSFEPLMDWWSSLGRRELRCSLQNGEVVGGSWNAASYLGTFLTTLNRCSGSPATNGPHLQVLSHLSIRTKLSVPFHLHKEFDGSIRTWFKDFVSVEKTMSKGRCWRVHEGEGLCAGKVKEAVTLVVSLPAILVLELGEDIENAEELTTNPVSRQQTFPIWNFPKKLMPLTKSLAKEHELAYDLISLGLFSPVKQHYVGRYIEGEGQIFTYDGMKHKGRGHYESEATITTHLSGTSDTFPTSFVPNIAIYHLCGGTVAQKVFYEHQALKLSENYGLTCTPPDFSDYPVISYAGDDLTKLENSQRTWLIRPDTSWDKTEYVTATPVEALSDTNLTSTPSKSLTPLTPLTPPIPPIDETHAAPTTPTRNPNALRPSSPPDSPFHIKCRCGEEADGNVLFDAAMVGTAIQCDDCKRWSHVACQQDGRAGHLAHNEPFYCDPCRRSEMLKANRRVSERKQFELRTRMNRPLHERLIPGRGALARDGDFWYPVRLIQYDEELNRWTIKWWRGCNFGGFGSFPGKVESIEDFYLVDSLWGERYSRRSTRLGCWTHANHADAIPVLDVHGVHDIGHALTGADFQLRQLVTNPDQRDSRTCPAKRWLENEGRTLDAAFDLERPAYLSVGDRAQVDQWLQKSYNGYEKSPFHQLVTMHAYTLILAYRLANMPSALAKLGLDDSIYFNGEVRYGEDTDCYHSKEVLNKVWEMLLSSEGDFDELDVDRECLERLEEEMFEQSARAGIAGNCQWGLDAGDHQGGWNPYKGLPDHFNHHDREGSDGETQCGFQFVAINPTATAGDTSENAASAVESKAKAPVVRKKKKGRRGGKRF